MLPSITSRDSLFRQRNNYRSKVVAWDRHTWTGPGPFLAFQGRQWRPSLPGWSFRDLSVGEAPAPSECKGTGGGGKFPSPISRRKDGALPPVTPEKAPALSEARSVLRDPVCVTQCKHS